MTEPIDVSLTLLTPSCIDAPFFFQKIVFERLGRQPLQFGVRAALGFRTARTLQVEENADYDPVYSHDNGTSTSINVLLKTAIFRMCWKGLTRKLLLEPV